jgi:hypothetical protein
MDDICKRQVSRITSFPPKGRVDFAKGWLKEKHRQTGPQS